MKKNNFEFEKTIESFPLTVESYSMGKLARVEKPAPYPVVRYIDKETSLTIIKYENPDSVWVRYNDFDYPIYSVSELQNVYYYITGKELEIDFLE